jgi:hypothetical protein
LHHLGPERDQHPDAISALEQLESTDRSGRFRDAAFRFQSSFYDALKRVDGTALRRAVSRPEGPREIAGRRAHYLLFHVITLYMAIVLEQDGFGLRDFTFGDKPPWSSKRQ